MLLLRCSTEATVLCIELWCACDALPSFVRTAVSNAAALAVTVARAVIGNHVSVDPGLIAIAGLLVYITVDILVAEVLRAKPPSCWW